MPSALFALVILLIFQVNSLINAQVDLDYNSLISTEMAGAYHHAQFFIG
jgi:hypothetical protein